MSAITIAVPPVAFAGADDGAAVDVGANLRLQLGHATTRSVGNPSGSLSAARHCGQEIANDMRRPPFPAEKRADAAQAASPKEWSNHC